MFIKLKIARQHWALVALRIALGIFFVYVGIRKIFNLQGFIDDIARFEIVPVLWEEWVAYAGIGAEIVLGFCLLFKKAYVGAVLMTLAMCTVFVTIFLQAWIRGLSLSCHCLGVERSVTSYPFELGWRLVLWGVVFILFYEILKVNKKFFTSTQYSFSDDC